MSDLVFEFDRRPSARRFKALKNAMCRWCQPFLTGRLAVNGHINRADAFVVGWLPGTQAAALPMFWRAIKQASR